MKRREFGLVRQTLCVTIAAAALVMCGCKSGVGGTSGGSASSAESNAGPDPNKFSPTGASLCMQQMIKNPPEPLHLSFAETSSDNHAASVVADVTPATVDYTRRETSNGQTTTTTKHLARAQMSEMELDFAVMGPVPWHGELVAAQDAARSAGEQSVDGFNALEYTIDTANEPASQKATFESLMAVKDYKIVGTAWVTSDTGCLVKYAIDLEQDKNDGSVKKTHFEGDVTKK
ncbi:MAG: hypothetical protein WBE20_09245 [Candidatus Acidiferrales bacterium]